jgi:transcriptional regulator GlxA family with amidase domain
MGMKMAADLRVQDAAPARVAVLLFDDVEVLDFVGPFEVFGVARRETGAAAFEVLTVGLRAGEVVARNGLRVVPSCEPSTLGTVDILVVPGGIGTRPLLSEPEMLDFIRKTSTTAERTLSVCTGALLLGAAGLLAGRAATTHWAAMDELRALDCGAEILPHARIVDNGSIIVSAGVSAGIDAALYIVASILGECRAEETARYMQYEWRNARVNGRSVVKVKT